MTSLYLVKETLRHAGYPCIHNIVMSLDIKPKQEAESI